MHKAKIPIATETTLAGYDFDQATRVDLNRNGTVFVARATRLAGRPWLRFAAKIGNEGWYVTAHKLKREATR